MKLRLQSLWWLAILFTHASAITLLGVIQSHPELSTLSAYVNASSSLTDFVTKADNFTFLAPNNDAIAKFLTNNPNVLTEGLLEATLQYSLLWGGHPKLSFTDTPQFVTTNLYNGTYTNVTAGQYVELVLGSDGTPQAISGNRSVSTPSTADLVCTGGIIHIMNEVLSVPVQTVSEITEAGLEYAVSILSNGGYLSAGNADYVNTVLDVPNLTYFIPNTPEALSAATAFAANSSAAEQQSEFQHHLVPNFVGFSTRLTNGTSLQAMNGQNLTITVEGNDTFVNAAKIIAADYLVSNGVMHVIDNLITNTTTPPAEPKSDPQAVPAPTASSSSSSAPTQSPTSSSSASTNSDSSQSSDSKSLSTGATVGIAVGSSAGGLLLLSALVFWLLRRRRNSDRGSVGWSESTPGGHHEKGNFYPTRPYRETPVPGQEPHIMMPHGTSTPDVPHRSPKRLDQREFF